MPEPSRMPPAGGTITNSIGMKLVLIPAGEFMMGNSHTVEEEIAAFKPYYGDLKPDDLEDQYLRHRVRITRPFYLGAYPVTVGQFRQFVKDTGHQTDAEKEKYKRIKYYFQHSWRNPGFEQTDEHPVLGVSWSDAVAFCRWLSRKEGKDYRLPTEAEWEYACRAGTTTRYWFGDDPEGLAQVANIADAAFKAKFPHRSRRHIRANDGYVFTSPVGKFRPNGFGLYDMYGNSTQWCSDWYGKRYYEVSPTDDPTGPNSGTTRVLRGGAWNAGPVWSACRSHSWFEPGYADDYIGFRVVCEKTAGGTDERG